ncbi:AAA family ATPase [Lactonifactor longoviformis]|uniref:AAA family ATPase n=1 Tax=Lactonifactor longoviformis TaxID=341220 RepID=UPI001D025912|nr:AAA family ATPase [Lactonifactor longoviformis]MCB5714534.1 AAA family ATPase [Lactonifactor longoviformis]MCB5718488.1 AAA family ATPase [Lactonifactor longoviformis]
MIDSTESRGFKFYSTVIPKEVEWLWYPYIPYGKLTLIQGDPGEGKSTFIIQVISILTNGLCFPGGRDNVDSQNVIYQCAEDSLADTVMPRLIRSGADCEKVLFIPEDDRTLTVDDSRIEETIVESGAKLLVLDPIQAFIPQDADMQNAASMRNVMRRLADVAERNECAIILIGHMNKSSSGKKLYRGLGSIDIAAIARSVLMVSRDQENSEIRYMYPIKASLAPEGETIAFSLSTDQGFQWIGKCDRDPSQFEDVDVTLTKKDRAKEYLKLMLMSEDLPSTEIMTRINSFGIADKTIRIAQKELGITAYRKENAWYWHWNNE